MSCGNLSRATYEGVSELRRRNAELEARVAELTQALRQVEAVSRRTAGAAHDIRNALTVILAEADLLTHSLREPDQVESAKSVTSAAQIVASITQDLLIAARKSEWRLDRKNERRNTEVNSSALLASCQKLARRIVNPTIQCAFSVDPGLWPVAIQPEQLEAALLNLVANARDAMPAGGTLRISARNLARGTATPCDLPPGNYVGFAVEDTGLGMSPRVLARATEAFFTTKPREQGTGLGLAMVSAFATEAGGALHLSSQVGHGTRAEILLPRAPVQAQPLDAGDARFAIVEKIRRRVRTPWLVDVLDAWGQVCSPGGLPHPGRLEAVLLDHSGCSLVLAVDLVMEPIELRLVRMGEELVEQLERSAVEAVALNGPELFANLATTYRRALRSRCPTYQYARHDLGHGSRAQFERLVLPAATDETVSHLFGIVLMSSNVMGGEHEPSQAI
jgi:nitrogen-specific signal transduction histidine kinase